MVFVNKQTKKELILRTTIQKWQNLTREALTTQGPVTRDFVFVTREEAGIKPGHGARNADSLLTREKADSPNLPNEKDTYWGTTFY